MSDRYFLVLMSLLCSIASNVTDGWSRAMYGLAAFVFAVLYFVDLYLDRCEKKARR